MSLNIILFLSCLDFYIYYIYILLTQFWHFTNVNVRLSYYFRASLLWTSPYLIIFNSDPQEQKKTCENENIAGAFQSTIFSQTFVKINIGQNMNCISFLLFSIEAKKKQQGWQHPLAAKNKTNNVLWTHGSSLSVIKMNMR